jgi:PAS domain S-box-containing protein
MATPDATRDPEQLERELDEVRSLLQRYLIEREAAEEELRESDERCRSLICRAAFGIYRATPAGRFIDANPALIRMLGYGTSAEVEALDMARDVYCDPNTHATLVANALIGDVDGWHDAQWRRKDGSTINVRLSMRAVRERRGGPPYIEAVAEDVTERLRREELMRRSERMASLGGLLAGVAHELNNPLASISGFAQILLRQAGTVHLSPDDVRSALETIDREARRAAKIVKDLLTFARREASRERVPVDLSAIARYIVSSQRYAIETRGIRRVCDLGDDVPPVLGDATQLEQVVLNLVVNARQALEEAMDDPAHPMHRAEGRRPELRVRTSFDGEHVVLEVADNGPGISEHDRSRIWDPFWTTRGDDGGTGLGLSVAHSIVTEHGGTIEVESAPNDGTRFVIRLPAMIGGAVNAVDANGAVVAQGNNGHLAQQPLDVLVFGTSAVALSVPLAARGHATMAVTSLEEAIPLAEEGLFDVMVCDRDGDMAAEVERRLRAVPACATMRLVIFRGDEEALISAVEGV